MGDYGCKIGNYYCEEGEKNLILILKIFVIRKFKEATQSIIRGTYEPLKDINSSLLVRDFLVIFRVRLNFFLVNLIFLVLLSI